jgi:hypothetical protein
MAWVRWSPCRERRDNRSRVLLTAKVGIGVVQVSAQRLCRPTVAKVRFFEAQMLQPEGKNL